jgi:hypothetical protein
MRRRVLSFVPLMLLLSGLPAAAQNAPAAAQSAPTAADAVEATGILGMQLKPVVDAFGLPQSMFTFRGSDETRDDVVFYYPDHMYLFWYKDRVWQVRLDRHASAVVHGVSLGMSRSEVEAAVPERPFVASSDSLYFDLDSASFPVRVRLVFAGDVVSDIYVYRSDF